jgi:hypothetical protein
MNIFPRDLQYFIVQLYFQNKKEIIKLYTVSNFSNPELRGYYPPEKIKKGKKRNWINFYLKRLQDVGI